VGMLSDKYWVTQLDEEARRRRAQGSFHAFAEGQHSDLRGQIYNLEDGGEVSVPHDRWPHHLFIVVGIHGTIDAHIESQVFPLRAQSQLVILPGTPCKLTARSAAALELISFLSTAPRSTGR
jgi:hypothetical protein